ncbi:MAG: cell division protein FtsA [Chloroflexi bacterium]|nr:cell division protein FtsA [Chloroflexota bacterium]
MVTTNLYMAIDVGTTKVCTLIAQVAPNGDLEVVGAGVESSRGMRKGRVVDLAEMRQAVRSSVALASDSLDRDCPSAFVGVTGSHISSIHTTGTLDTLNADSQKTITRRELELVLKQSYPVVTREQELLHVIPEWYTVDSLREVKNPVGLKGHQLTVHAHAVVGEAASLDNVVRAVEGTGVSVKSMVLEPLASAEAVLTPEEKEAGVVLVDIGGGTSDMAVFKGGVMIHTAVIPVAGYQFTNDLAVAFAIPYESAEAAKLAYGNALPDLVDASEMVEVAGYEGERPQHVRRRELCRLINDRGSELLRLLLLKIREAGLKTMPPAGIVFTGGAANLAGWEALARETIPGPIRIASPKEIPGLPMELKSPTYSTSVGILLWGIRHPSEQSEYHLSNGLKSFVKGRRWLRWLAQFIAPKR